MLQSATFLTCAAFVPSRCSAGQVLRVDEFEQVLPGAEDTSDVWNVCLCKVLKSNGLCRF